MGRKMIKKDSLVERDGDFCPICAEIMTRRNVPFPPLKQVFVVTGSDGDNISLLEFPGFSYCAAQFVEVQAPGEVDLFIEEINFEPA